MRPEKLVTEVAAPWAVLMAGSTALGVIVRAPGWGLATGVGLGGLPQTAIAIRVRRKTLSDHHVTSRKDRPVVIAGIAASVIALMAAQERWSAPPELRRLTRAALVSLAVAGAATLRVKVSFHTAVLSGMVAVFAREVSPRCWWGLSLVPPVAWARVRVGHHSPAETVLGSAIGAAGGYWGSLVSLRR